MKMPNVKANTLKTTVDHGHKGIPFSSPVESNGWCYREAVGVSYRSGGYAVDAGVCLLARSGP